jgi:hypothetical protein
MLFSSTSAFLAALAVVLLAGLLISRFPFFRRLRRPTAAAGVVAAVVLTGVGFSARSHEQARARAQLRIDTRFVAQEVVQAEQQKLKTQGAFSSISYHDPEHVSVVVTAVDGTHANARVWSKQVSFRFKLTPQGATPSPFPAPAKPAAVSGSAVGR